MNQQSKVYSNDPVKISRCELALEEAKLRHTISKVQDTTSLKAAKSQQASLHMMMKIVDSTSMKSEELSTEEKSEKQKNQTSSTAAVGNTTERQRKRPRGDEKCEKCTAVSKS